MSTARAEKNGWADQDAVLGPNSHELKEPCTRRRPVYPQGKGYFAGKYLNMPGGL